MKFITLKLNDKKNLRPAAGIVFFIGVCIYLVVQASSFALPAAKSENQGEITQADMEAAEISGYDFKDGFGMITISCEYSGSGGVHVFVNGRMKLYVAHEPKNLKVKAGDIIMVRGAELEGTAEVTISEVIGKIDASQQGTSVTVGNLARRLVKIEKAI